MVNKYENILNKIYCLSQEACSTITNLRLVPGIAKDINSYRLYVLLEKLNEDTLEAFRTVNLNLSEQCLNKCLKELFSIGSVIKKTYEIFEISVVLTNNQEIIKKLEHQIDSLSLVLLKLYKLGRKTRVLNESGLITE